MNTEDYRSLTNIENAILGKLLKDQFPGRDQIVEQIKNAKVRTIDEYKDNYGSIEFLIPQDVPVSRVDRFVIECMSKDKDDVPIEFILHIVNGRVKELEIVKADGSPIKMFPDTVDIEVKSI